MLLLKVWVIKINGVVLFFLYAVLDVSINVKDVAFITQMFFIISFVFHAQRIIHSRCWFCNKQQNGTY